MIAIEPGCVCGSIGHPSTNVRLCELEGHHRYWRGDHELVSVSHVLRSVWPFKPNFSGAKPSVLRNALHRGVVVDSLFSQYLNGELKAIPPGTRLDSLRLFWKVKRWWSDHKHGDVVRAQVIVADNEIAGTLDIRDFSVPENNDAIYDLKTTYAIEPHYALQLGAYAALYWETFNRSVKKLGILHLTERFPEPKLILLDPAETIRDWLLVRDVYFMAQRRRRESK